jgi:hypothetical protein
MDGAMASRCGTAAFLLVALAGCGRDEEYVQAIRTQIASLEETNRLLASIKDAGSMESVKDALAEQYAKSEANADRARRLPRPSAALRERLQEEGGQMERLARQYLEEIERIKTLPRGNDFLVEVGLLTRAKS